jgi:acyl-CoA dehydrogenase
MHYVKRNDWNQAGLYLSSLKQSTFACPGILTLAYKADWLYDRGKRCVKEASMAKLYASDVVQWVAIEAVQVLGGYGYGVEYPVERYYRDAMGASLTEGTSEIQHVIIARELEL